MIKTQKNAIIESFKAHEGDTGSTEIQIAILTDRINQLTRHMAGNKHDFSTQRGLLKLVGQRRRLLNYLSKENVSRYHQVIGKLGLRK
ncbi:MAG: 30S ribosomal protein S15 [Dehalococcoidales bacterium]|nr:30S ribosomal protein S15 [Dehalococcoidales bacterium]